METITIQARLTLKLLKEMENPGRQLNHVAFAEEKKKLPVTRFAGVQEIKVEVYKKT